ncbi:TIGR02270 family protein [Polaromonas glacialis]|uniref:TIGR02270 family protein n=1 Tax=Polaromonas glacialis TaxID=866564 RepID=UPI000497C926|nr:TIGR02270 family protein [Polaromonas glacialis]
MPIPSVKSLLLVACQHAEEAANLGNMRLRLAKAPHVKLQHLRRLDDRLAGHLDGLAIAGEFGWKLCDASLDNPGVGEIFAACARAIEGRDMPRLDKLLAMADSVPELQRGLTAAFGWVSAQFLTGTIQALLVSESRYQRQVGIAACNMHRVDPGNALVAALEDADRLLRARGLRVAGESGRRNLLSACACALSDPEAVCRFWSARSAVLLGERDQAVDMLEDMALHKGPHQLDSLQLVLRLFKPVQSRALLQVLAQDRPAIRTMIQGIGAAGDPYYVPWLIRQMLEEKLARLAGESFSLITGIDLADLDLDRKPPNTMEAGPSDDPNDIQVEMDDDEGLPWPDPLGIQRWWELNSQRFTPGVCYFMGEPVNARNCKVVLRHGYQRQRSAAADYLSLLEPGIRLFPTCAPAWRQERWLNKTA